VGVICLSSRAGRAPVTAERDVSLWNRRRWHVGIDNDVRDDYGCVGGI